MKKTTIVINGPGGVGKDSLIETVSGYKVKNVSSITPIKEVATFFGWDGIKDDKSRKFLSDLKALSIEYNDFPTKWALKEYEKFKKDNEHDILFVHIREPEEIAKFSSLTNCKTLFISQGERKIHEGKYGNKSDDNIKEYPYDYIFVNDKDFEKIREEFQMMIDEIVMLPEIAEKFGEF